MLGVGVCNLSSKSRIGSAAAVSRSSLCCQAPRRSKGAARAPIAPTTAILPFTRSGASSGAFMSRDARRRDPTPYLPVSTHAAGGDVSKPYHAEQAASLQPVLLAAAVASMGAFAFGYHLGVLNGPLAEMAAQLGFAGNPQLSGLVISMCLAGAALGSISGAGLAEKFGRKGTLMLDTIPLALGAAVMATATSLNALIAGRVLAGIGIGLASAIVPLYISESHTNSLESILARPLMHTVSARADAICRYFHKIAPTEVRGALGSVNQLVICLGILGALLVNVVYPPTAWRTMLWLSAIPAVILGIGMSLMPESPRWQYGKGLQTEAQAGAVKLWGQSGPDQLSEGKTPSGAAQGGASLGKLLTTKSVILGGMIFAFQQFAGINAIIYFSSSVFAQAGVKSQALASAGVGAINVLGTIVAGSLVDKAGRKQLLLVSFLGMAATMLAMSAGLGLPSLQGASGTIALVGTLAYVLSFALGAGAVPGVLVSEINPAAIRGPAVSFALTVHWICNFAIGQLFLSAVTAVGVSGVYLGFAAVCLLATLFINTYIIETKGRSLEDIERAMA